MSDEAATQPLQEPEQAQDQQMVSKDTQFAGFAELLLEELLNKRDGMIDTSDWWKEQAKVTIARRVYDLACHVSTQTLLIAHGDMSKIPDMTTWTEETSK
jgi:hypothetical protein